MKPSGRILIVDDNASIHEDIRKILTSAMTAQEVPRLGELEAELFGISETRKAPGIPDILYEIDDAYQGEEAVALVRKAHDSGRPYSMVFMDVRMPPGMDGISAIEQIWKSVPDIEVVICTAYSDYSWDDILSRLGMSDRLLFLRKPVDSVSVKQTALALCRKFALGLEVKNHIETLESQVADRTRALTEQVQQKEFYIQTITEDLELAQLVQRHILPRQIQHFENLDIAARYLPAAEIGGDFYLIHRFDDHRIAVAILDVAGHGIASALITAVAKFALTQHLQKAVSPAHVLGCLNTDIFSCTPEELYLSAFLLFIDLETYEGLYCNAGHPAPMLHRAGEDKPCDLSGGGHLVGLFEDSRYRDTPVKFTLGDRLLMYTDGLIEGTNSRRIPYGAARLSGFIVSHPETSSYALLDAVLEDSNAVIENATRADDVCLVSLTFQHSEFWRMLDTLLSAEGTMTGVRFLALQQEEEIDTVNSQILRAMDQCGFADKLIKQMRVAVSEILLNALQHGNKYGAGRLIRLGYQVSFERIAVGVLDEGDGFDPALSPDGENARGLGITIARHCVDSLEFYGKGNCVVLITYRGKGDSRGNKDT